MEPTFGDSFNAACPSRLILRRIGDRWTVLVIAALKHDVLRFSELRVKIGGPAPKVLTETLRALERDGLVARKAYAEVPPRVEYKLTPLGHTLIEPLTAIQRWSELHMDDILAAREAADADAAEDAA
jgi:DNA-binding HxlR family transcriptional regulator